MLPLPRPSILDIEPYVAGSSKADGANRTIKLSSNEGAFGPPPAAVAAARDAVAHMHRYPDGGSLALRSAIGRRFDLDPSRIVCGCGSDELISHLCLSYGGPDTELIMSAHGFIMYEIAGRYAGSTVIKAPEQMLTADVDAILRAVSPRTRLVFVANPNNPTGSLLPATEVARLRAGLPENVLLVLDAAYAEYVEAPDYDPGISLVDDSDNTVMLRTFSKVFGLGGMRVGWAYGPPPVIDVLNRVRGVFNINLPAQAAAQAALMQQDWVEASQRHNRAARERLSEGLRAIGIKVWPSAANFVLADFGTAAAAGAADRWLKSRGIVVRAMGSYGLPHTLRVTVGTNEEVEAVLEAMTGFPGAE